MHGKGRSLELIGTRISNKRSPLLIARNFFSIGQVTWILGSGSRSSRLVSRDGHAAVVPFCENEQTWLRVC